MARRTIKNKTGFGNKAGVNHKEAWVCFPCVKCGNLVRIKIGLRLPTPEESFEDAIWTCPNCGYEHSCISDLPDSLANFPSEWRSCEDPHCQSFWRAFFRMCTKDVFSFWKQCSKCGRILPVTCFDAHSGDGWKPLNRQAECKACKGAINANLNKLRTKEQLFEGTIGRRIGDLLSSTDEKIDPKVVFNRFGGKCFKTKVKLDYNDRASWHIDHIMPSKYFWPLTYENAALLSEEQNEAKSGKWPSEFYTDKELVELAKITGANLEFISSKEPIYNMNIDPNKAVERLFGNVRESSHLPKLVQGLKKVILDHDLGWGLTEQNKKLLGITEAELYLNVDDEQDPTKFVQHQYKNYDLDDFAAFAAEDIHQYGSIEIHLPNIRKDDLVNGRLKLVLMYAISPNARTKTENAGKIAIGIKEDELTSEQINAYTNVKYIIFHYWSNPKPFSLIKKPQLVDRSSIPSDYLIRAEKENAQYLLVEYNPENTADIGEYDILKLQAERTRQNRYKPFVTTLERIR